MEHDRKRYRKFTGTWCTRECWIWELAYRESLLMKQPHHEEEKEGEGPVSPLDCHILGVLRRLPVLDDGS
jgi:hypothetical protein